MDFDTRYKQYLAIIEEWLEDVIPPEGLSDKEFPEKTIYEAMRYSLMSGGKRIRPVLSLAVCNMLNGDEKEVIPYAGAIELIHTYSLIHDDLPCMDNDDYRRGKLTNHKVFGYATAILAGDGLLNLAFEIMLRETMKVDDKTFSRLKTAYMISVSSGIKGMIGGQVIDMESEKTEISYDLLCQMHRKKTGALIRASVLAPALLLNAGKDIVEKLEIYAENIGIAFQIKDDILDYEGDSEIIGKSTGSDTANNKSTFVSILGIEKAKELLKTSVKNAVNALDGMGNNEFLTQIAFFISERNK
ncbi:MAG TPA: polyprenyl synthetase family protein [Clostridiaceae bacterium]|jgi:geranylgeranyl diphosphate synthase type II|nr:polyprenyl synthetase family protein [Clostridiaceae bacterium]